MRKWLNNYFDFTKSEFNGLLVLIFLIAFVTLSPYAYAMMVKEEFKAEDYLVVKRLILKNSKATNSSVFTTPQSKFRSSTAAKRSLKVLTYFDPNTLDQTGWVNLGLSPNQAKSIVKYVDKGGKFTRTEDLKKMYTISSEKYLELAPYVRILPDVQNNASIVQKQTSLSNAYKGPVSENTDKAKNTATLSRQDFPKKQMVIVEINQADSAALDEIRGIGPAFAMRIINYRERIGGYVTKEQLMEVFGLDSLKYAEIKHQITVDASSIKKININTATADQFKNHPYLRFKQINAIVQYRKQHGNFSTLADLAKVIIVPPETIARLAPYLTF
jgi:competence protein ComEA